MKNNTSLIFTGDIGFDRYMEGRFRSPQLLSNEIRNWLASADHVVANVEGALIRAKDDGSRGQWFHCMDPDAAELLAQMGADVWNISNNHIMDAGEEGLVSTRAIAAGFGFQTIGAGRNEEEASEPVYLDEAGGIGLIGVAYMTECIPAGPKEPGVFRWDDRMRIAARIAQVKSRCRWCIVVAHGGEEFADLPNPYTRNRYLDYLELGADAVVAHHPHVTENYELLENGKAIFYSLGNFIFDTDYQRAHPYTDRGVLLKLLFTPEKMSFEALGTQIIRGEERIEAAPLPAVFTDISADQYQLLSPLAAKVFLQEERKKMIYLEPQIYAEASEARWRQYFFSTEPDGYDAGAHMDLSLIVPLAEEEERKEWTKSSLNTVIAYLTERPQ